jgi:hypothetical protein
MYWRLGSSNRVPALQVQSPDFKSQSRPKKIIFRDKNLENVLYMYPLLCYEELFGIYQKKF